MRDSCGTSGQVRPLKGAKRRGGSPHAPRKAKQPGMEINYFQEYPLMSNHVCKCKLVDKRAKLFDYGTNLVESTLYFVDSRLKLLDWFLAALPKTVSIWLKLLKM
ncbi:hypothetical protein ABE41_013510 [Fictibacillus arsenicus]|uniref:Uncharacterized protein n=1 Tax=Fictibacillus arsenicus TaxID=255247 RepID=A0A1B1Z6H9_9BACL|nr:hypothetical protein ABE41_013510 [Fictibacillus arsenicus]